jgi:hypothetical protein
MLAILFLLHAEKNTLATETVRTVGFNEFLQYASLHNLLLIYYLLFLSNSSRLSMIYII